MAAAVGTFGRAFDRRLDLVLCSFDDGPDFLFRRRFGRELAEDDLEVAFAFALLEDAGDFGERFGQVGEAAFSTGRTWRILSSVPSSISGTRSRRATSCSSGFDIVHCLLFSRLRSTHRRVWGVLFPFNFSRSHRGAPTLLRCSADVKRQRPRGGLPGKRRGLYHEPARRGTEKIKMRKVFRKRPEAPRTPSISPKFIFCS